MKKINFLKSLIILIFFLSLLSGCCTTLQKAPKLKKQESPISLSGKSLYRSIQNFDNKAKRLLWQETFRKLALAGEEGILTALYALQECRGTQGSRATRLETFLSRPTSYSMHLYRATKSPYSGFRQSLIRILSKDDRAEALKALIDLYAWEPIEYNRLIIIQRFKQFDILPQSAIDLLKNAVKCAKTKREREMARIVFSY
jgi:hypothetical protein